VRYQNPCFSERDARDQNVVRSDALTGAFKMGAGTAGDLGPCPRERQNFKTQTRSGSRVRDCVLGLRCDARRIPFPRW
jgi:hypothetical protein